MTEQDGADLIIRVGKGFYDKSHFEAHKAMRFHKTAILLVMVALICLLAGCERGGSGKVAKEAQPVSAAVIKAEPVQLPVYVKLPGTVVSAYKVEISSRLTGYVQGLEIHEGQSVRKGQLLFTVNPTEVKAQINQAKAETARAAASLVNARANYVRYRDLYLHKAATGETYHNVETAYRVAQHGYQAALAALSAARSQLRYAEVHAPFDGLVVSKLVDNGQLAGPGTPVLVVENPNHLQVQVQATEQAFVHLKLGQQINIRLEGPDYAMRTLTGEVERLVAAANPVTHTHLVKIGLQPGSRVYSGEYAVVSIPVAQQEGIVLPAGAIHERAGIEGVFVVTSEQRAQFRMVTPGERLPRGTVVLSGVFPGDRVIVSAKGPLANGVKIRIQKEAGA